MTTKDEAITALQRLYGCVIASKGRDNCAYKEYNIVLGYLEPPSEEEEEK